MNKLHEHIRSSLSVKLSLLSMLLASSVFLVALFLLFTQIRRAVTVEAMEHATEELDNTVERVNTILAGVEVATVNTLWHVRRQLDSPDSMLVLTRAFMDSNPQVQGCSIAFEPYYFEEKGRYFAPYSGYDEDGSIISEIEGSSNYQYFYMDWYQLCKLLDRPAWTDPFLDADTDIDNYAEMIVSYSIPIKDDAGNYVGTLSADLPLRWLSTTISSVKPYPNSYSIMIGRNGTFFVHQDPSKLLYESIFTPMLEKDDPDRMELGLAMVHGEEGVRKVEVDGETSYVFYKPLGETGFSVAIVCPEKDIFGRFNRLRRIVLTIILWGGLLISFVMRQIIRKQLKPLERLADQAEIIAAGDLDKTLPTDPRADEIGRLEQSFTNMQRSLVGYIEEVKQSVASQASIENELKVASNIQMSMVPRVFPDRSDIDLYAFMTPAKDVGGDLYDFFIKEERLYFCVGDVSGKGVPASLFMAVTRNLFRIIAQQGYAPEEIATKINNALAEENEQGMFVTLFIGMVDLKTGRLDFCNCGHNPPVVCIPGENARFLKFKHMNIALGVLGGLLFRGERLEDIRGWRILVYTDGLNEAENADYDLFGKDKILSIMDEVSSRSSEEVIRKLQDEVELHRSGAIPSDDLTLLSLKLLS